MRPAGGTPKRGCESQDCGVHEPGCPVQHPGGTVWAAVGGQMRRQRVRPRLKGTACKRARAGSGLGVPRADGMAVLVSSQPAGLHAIGGAEELSLPSAPIGRLVASHPISKQPPYTPPPPTGVPLAGRLFWRCGHASIWSWRSWNAPPLCDKRPAAKARSKFPEAHRCGRRLQSRDRRRA